MSQSLIDLDTELTVSKSPSVASNDSMGDYAADAADTVRDNLDYEPPKAARRASPSMESLGSLPEDPPQNADKEVLVNLGRSISSGPAPPSGPMRPPPPTQTALERNAVGRGSGRRPASYMNAVTSVEVDGDDTNGNQQQPTMPPPLRPPIAPRRTHMKTASMDENRTVLTINDTPVSPDSSKPRPPIPAKPPRNIDEQTVTKL
jgi:hypothetical protein